MWMIGIVIIRREGGVCYYKVVMIFMIKVKIKIIMCNKNNKSNKGLYYSSSNNNNSKM